ncbi:CDGSH iron-sulfur domain-containing protein [Hyphomicrobium sp.]|uniref:CDGSH iron-sulfur domain-containing protein n=1 Tax=Hyphomicrobium sp. TaxID=82 RepID=UPI002FE034EC
MPHVTQGASIDVSFDRRRCIHSRNCVLGQPTVFEPGAKDWIHPDADTADRIAAQVALCPSGALTYHRKDDGPQEQAPPVNTLRLQENGPYVLRGDLRIGEERLFRATLCRCGRTKNRPFCDGSHTAAGFCATGEPEPNKSEPLEARDGPLVITPLKNACLKVEGNLEIVAGSGRRLDRVRETYLCRCGNSGTKPFCDGTHEKVGWE